MVIIDNGHLIEIHEMCTIKINLCVVFTCCLSIILLETFWHENEGCVMHFSGKVEKWIGALWQVSWHCQKSP